MANTDTNNTNNTNLTAADVAVVSRDEVDFEGGLWIAHQDQLPVEAPSWVVEALQDGAQVFLGGADGAPYLYVKQD